MGIDSTANLLFAIGANTDEAEGNIGKFRTLMSKDLGDMREEFAQWAEEVFGDMTTVEGATLAATAGLAAGVLAVGAAMYESGNKFVEYVGEIARGSKSTGIAAENMSALHFAADETHTSYDELTTGLTRFASTVAKANEGGKAQQQMFTRLGISQADVAAGEKDLWPLLMKVADAFQDMGSKVQRTAQARDFFGRGAAGLTTLMAQGSAGIEKFAEEMRKLGLQITSQDIVAVNEYKAAIQAAKNEQEALEMQVGRYSLPIMRALRTEWAGLIVALKGGGEGPNFIERWITATREIKQQTEELAKSLGKLGGGSGIDDLDKGAKEAKDDFRGLTDVLDTIYERMQSGAGDIGKAAAELYKLDAEVGKLTAQYRKLADEGKITGESAAREAAVLAKLPAAIADLWTTLSKEATEKIAGDVTRFGQELQQKINAQGRQTMAVQTANFDLEIKGLRAQLAEKKDLTSAQYEELNALIESLEKAGLDKISRDKAEAIAKEGNEIERRTLEQTQKSYTAQVAAWNREIDAMEAAYFEKEELTEETQAKLDSLRKAGIAKIDAERAADYAREITGLQEHLATMLSGYMTHAQKLEAEYQKDLLKFGAVEEAKVLAVAVGETKQAAVRAQFAAIREELTRRYALDLQQLTNSQGWQGVFGSKFEEGIKHNEALMKQWATSTNQSALLVKVALENLKEMASATFDSFAQGMGAGIAQAIVYQKSISAAMEAALKSTLESLAARALTEAIYATAWGFMDLAEQNYAGATAAFTAAAIFGSVGAAAGVAGSLIPSGQSGAGASGGAGGGSGVGASGGASTATTPTPTTQGPNIHVNVYGHVYGTSGVNQLLQMINDAVLNKNATLTATNTKTSQVVVR